jgi:hypothetical protein
MCAESLHELLSKALHHKAASLLLFLYNFLLILFSVLFSRSSIEFCFAVFLFSNFLFTGQTEA